MLMLKERGPYEGTTIKASTPNYIPKGFYTAAKKQ